MELLSRRQARRDLIAFTEYTYGRYQTGVHHRRIADRLEAVARGEVDRLMIFMPPRHGKSELASRRFPAWYLGQHPDRSIIGASYNSDLAGDFGRDVRNIVATRHYQALFDVMLAPDSRSMERWHTDKDGMYVAAGVGTAITGRGAHVLLIDDPLKDRSEAESERRRDVVWDWYTSTAYTRLMPGGAIVLIQTRWHEDDLAGRLLLEMQRGGDQWEVLMLPAIGEDNAALWPEWYDIPKLERIRSAIGERDWNALYQQNPTPAEGNFFKRDWLRWYDTPPTRLHIYGASDYAVTADAGDYTVHGVAGVDPDDNLYVLDWWRSQAATDVWIEALLDLAHKWKPLMWAGEQGQIIKSVGPFLEQRQREREVYFAHELFVSTADKPTRAQSIRGRMAMGKVYLPRNAPWLTDFLASLLGFPAAMNDDDVDVMSLFGRLLDQMVGAERAKGPPRKPRDRWDRAFDRDEEDMDAWKVA